MNTLVGRARAGPGRYLAAQVPPPQGALQARPGRVGPEPRRLPLAARDLRAAAAAAAGTRHLGIGSAAAAATSRGG